MAVYDQMAIRIDGKLLIENTKIDLSLDGTESLPPEQSDSIATFAWDLDNDGQFDDAVGANPSVAWAALAGLPVGRPAQAVGRWRHVQPFDQLALRAPVFAGPVGGQVRRQRIGQGMNTFGSIAIVVRYENERHGG